jgi:uncharacterized Ntn-hydrolase superfamily protein
MTLSIIARCETTGQFGIAAATAVPAVGKLLTHARPGAGAVATQALLNPYLGIDGLALLAEGHGADAVVAELCKRDPMIERRQFAVMDMSGAAAVHTGSGCKDWAGAHSERNLSIQGNRLTGGKAIEKALRAYHDASDKPFVERLADAIDAGVRDGAEPVGDRLGERSATIYVVDREEYPLWDIRVDDHADPIGELRRLKKVFEKDLLPHIKEMPTRAHPGGTKDPYDV